MEIKINFDSIFGTNSSSETVPESFQSESESECSSISVNTTNYQFNHQLFHDDEIIREQKPAKVKPVYSKANSVVTVKTEFSERAPGERLYYESRNNVAKKMLEIERIKSEKVEEQIREATFKPVINENSKKIVNQKGKQNIIGKKKVEKAVPTHIIREREELVECTHRPELKKAKHQTSSNRESDRFEELYNDYKLKEVRMKIMTEESLPNKGDKKLSKEEFEGFLNRNNEFMNKVQKKNELILATSTKFDLQTGHKMFSPKTNTFKPHNNYFASKTEEKNSEPLSRYNTTKEIKTKPLFSKNYDSFEEPSPFKIGSEKKISESNEEFESTSFHRIKEQVEEEEVGEEDHSEGVKIFDIDELSGTAPRFKVCSKQAEKPLQESDGKEKSEENSLKSSKCGKSHSRSYSFDKEFEENESPVRDELEENVKSAVKNLD